MNCWPPRGDQMQGLNASPSTAIVAPNAYREGARWLGAGSGESSSDHPPVSQHLGGTSASHETKRRGSPGLTMPMRRSARRRLRRDIPSRAIASFDRRAVHKSCDNGTRLVRRTLQSHESTCPRTQDPDPHPAGSPQPCDRSYRVLSVTVSRCSLSRYDRSHDGHPSPSQDRSSLLPRFKSIH